MKAYLAILCATTALGSAGAAYAQAAPQPAGTSVANGATPDTSGIVVTGTRIVRNGYDAPTPVSVITAAEINKAAPVTIADYVNQLPALQGSNGPRTSAATAGGGLGGANLLNLRNLGVDRTLVLLDGRRVTPSAVTGGVDINTLPQALVQRVDVVTGGASASYGSDAVSGVVNFVLDTKFTGLKGGFQGGVATNGAAQSQSADLSWGAKFGSDDRGHIVISANYSKQGGAWLRDEGWYRADKLITPNPNGLPTRLILPNSTANLTNTGLIISGPLKGTAFNGAGGVATTAFPFGAIQGGVLQSGGTQNTDMSLTNLQVLAPVQQGSIFGHASYDFTDNISGFVEGSYGDSYSTNYTGSYWRVNNEPISINNAYLPASVRTAMVANGISSFNLSQENEAIGVPEAQNRRRLMRFLTGLNGSFGSSWKWDVSGQWGQTNVDNGVRNNIIPGNVNQAINSVIGADGNPVCAVQTNGCVPYDPFGTRALTAAQKAFMTTNTLAKVRLSELTVDADLQGDLFRLPAGPVTLAVGGEYRRDSGGVVYSDPIGRAGLAYVANEKPFTGVIDDKEVYGELAVPVLKDSPLGKSLAFDGAIRYTDYSTSGSVVTWKIGGNYKPIRDIEFRLTYSRDIRAPNINDLYLGGTSLVQFLVDPTHGNQTYNVLQTTSGNPNLRPEKAKSLTAGIVLRPSFLPGVSASVDFYQIRIAGAIAVNSSQQIVNLCSAGQTIYCSGVVRDATGTLVGVNVQPFNAQSEKARGIDFEFGYQNNNVFGGTLDFRALINYVNQLEVDSVGANGQLIRVTRAGEAGDNLGSYQGSPNWRGTVTLSYTHGPNTVQLKSRFIGAANMEDDYGPSDVNLNNVPAIVYFDLYAGRDFTFLGGHKGTFFVASDNVFNKEPPVVVSQDPLVAQGSGTNLILYDGIGRTVRAGFRFQM
jgi:outer membrane receptor protein involved in Fe transport